MEAPGTPESDENNELSGRDNHNCVPIANVGRIMKRMVPEHVKITKDSKELVQQCVSEFICFITGEASERCKRDKRKTINGEDIIASMTMLGFEEYIPPLKLYLERYNQYNDRTPKHPSSRR